MNTLYFIRHGESEDNSNGIFSRPWSPLTEKGREQARATAVGIRKQGLIFDFVVASPLPRALETAQIVLSEIGHPVDAVETNDLFIERDWGALTGTSSAAFYDGSRTLADIDAAPGSEKLAAMQERARRALEYLQTRPAPTILLVGHGSFGRALRRVINGEPATNEYLPELVRYQNGEISQLV